MEFLNYKEIGKRIKAKRKEKKLHKKNYQK